MKRTLTIAAILIATFTISSVGIVASPTVAHAGNGSSILAQGQVGAAGVSAAQNATNAQGASPVNGGVVKQGQYSELMTWIMEIFAWLMGVAALLLDASVYWTVVHMGSVLGSSTQLMTTISTVWHTFVDLGDIALIFGFIALGVEVMLGMNFYGGGTKALPMLLLAAVFMNFSLFATEAVVDVGNFLATAVYQQINGGSLPSPSNFASLSSASVNNEPISNAIMAPLGLQTIYTEAFSNSGALNTSIDKSNYVWLIGILGCLLFIIVTFVLLSLAFVLIFRFVVLIFLIIASPLGFAGLIVPQLRGRAKQYWSMLIGEAMSAPILLFLLYVALRVIVNKTFLTGFGITSGGSNAWLGTIGSNNLNGFASILIAFLVAMGLLMVVAIAAKSLSKFGGSAATRAGAFLSVGMFAGAAGFAGRNFAAPGLARRADSVRSSKFGRTALGRFTATRLDSVAGSSFDVRNTSGMKKLAGSSLAKQAGFDLGKGSTKNYIKTRKESNEAREKYAKSLKQTPEEEAAQKRFEGMKEAEKINKEKNEKAYTNEHKRELAEYDKNIRSARDTIENAAAVHANLVRSAAEADAAGRKTEATALKQQQDIALTQLQRYQSDLRQIERDRQDAVNKHNEKLNEINEDFAKDQKATDAAIKTYKNGPRQEYADYLQKGSFVEKIAYGPEPQKAAKKIKEELNKKEGDKKFEDAVKKVMDENKGEGGGEEKKDDAH